MEEINKSGVIYKHTDKSQVFLRSYQEQSSAVIYCVFVFLKEKHLKENRKWEDSR